MKFKHLGIFGIISLLSYTAMVVFSPLAYPGYDWLGMAVSDLTAVGAPSAPVAERLNALFGPCAVVSVMAVLVAAQKCQSRLLKAGFAFFAAMEWITVTGYKMFPLVQGEPPSSFQNAMHIAVTILVVLFFCRSFGSDLFRSPQRAVSLHWKLGGSLFSCHDHRRSRHRNHAEIPIRTL